MVTESLVGTDTSEKDRAPDDVSIKLAAEKQKIIGP